MKPGRSRRAAVATVILCALGVYLVLPAMSAAAITSPPGATEGDQYFEEVPTGGGSSSPGHNAGGGGGAGGAGGGGVAGAVAADHALRALGPDGRAAAGLAEANRPPTSSGKSASKQGSQSSSSSSTEGEGGMGIWLPLLIAGSTVAAIAYGLRRRLYPAS